MQHGKLFIVFGVEARGITFGQGNDCAHFIADFQYCFSQMLAKRDLENTIFHFGTAPFDHCVPTLLYDALIAQ